MARAIDPYLDQIRTAIYGREVRSSIADGIEQCYDDATEVVEVSDSQPLGENVKLWVKPLTDEYQVPTWSEFSNISEIVDDLNTSRPIFTDDGEGNIIITLG